MYNEEKDKRHFRWVITAVILLKGLMLVALPLALAIDYNMPWPAYVVAGILTLGMVIAAHKVAATLG